MGGWAQQREISASHKITQEICIRLVPVTGTSPHENPKNFSMKYSPLGVLYCPMPINNKKADNIALCKQA